MSSLKDYFTSFADRQKVERLKQCLEVEIALCDCERIHTQIREAEEASVIRLPDRSKVSKIARVFGRSPAESQLLSSNNSQNHNQPLHDDAEAAAKHEASYRLQDSRAGMKIARFYDWGLSNPRAQQAVAAMRGDGGLRSLHPDSPGSGSGSGISALSPKDEISRSTNGTGRDSEAEIDTFRHRIHLDGASNPSCSRENHAVWGCRAMALGCATELVQLKKCFQKHEYNNPAYFAYDQNESPPESHRGELDIRTDVLNDDCRLDMQKLGKCVSINWEELDTRLNRH